MPDSSLPAENACSLHPGVRRRTRWLVWAVLLGTGLWLLYHAFWEFQLKRFSEVAPGVLYRSGQPTAFGLRYVIRRYGIRTVVSLRGRSRAALREGLCDWGCPDGVSEARLVRQLGAQYLHWPMGQEPYWPWLPPGHLEQFFRLMDDPSRHPVLVHCVAGRHRTGTFVALYRLEYDRWNVEQALLEMQRFGFGHPVLLQEHNLRTYWPRPRPDPHAWQRISRAWAGVCPPRPGETYQHWLWRLGRRMEDSHVQAHLLKWLNRGEPFALCVACRVMERLGPSARAQVTRAALRSLQSPEGSLDHWATAASLLADYGSPAQQAWLLRWLRQQVARPGPPSAKYQAVVWGVTSRYRRNRAAYWHVLLEDLRFRVAPRCRRYRYADTAAARVYCTFPGEFKPVVSWEQLRAQIARWFRRNPQWLRPRQWEPPHRLARPTDSPRPETTAWEQAPRRQRR